MLGGARGRGLCWPSLPVMAQKLENLDSFRPGAPTGDNRAVDNSPLLYSVIGVKFSRHFFNQSEVKPKPIVPRVCTFSRALCRLRAYQVLIGLLECPRPF